MNRKIFIKNTLPLALIPVLSSVFPMRSFASLPQYGAETAADSENIIVLIQLQGGNDGINTVIPLNQYKELTGVRKNILIPESKVLKLKDSVITGLHPSLSHLQGLYDAGEVVIVQGVGYPNPNYSHFRAADIWLTGSDADKVLKTGWIGRYLDQEFPLFPQGYPNNAKPHPPGIQIGSVFSAAFQGEHISLASSINSTANFYDLVLDTHTSAIATPADYELNFIRQTATSSKDYGKEIKLAAQAQNNLSPLYPPQGENILADQLRMVAQLIGGGLRSKVYMVSMDGFDTHGAQVDPSDPTDGMHSNLLKRFSEAVAAFMDDLKLMKKQDRVLGMAFSEFGRRIRSNAGYGTDHGSSGPVFLFGTRLKGGMVGTNPLIPHDATINDNLLLQNDFRAIYSTVLKDWLGVSESRVSSAVPGHYQPLDIFKRS